MAHTILTNLLLDTPSRVVAHITLFSDGASGELTDQVVLDASALTGGTQISTINTLQISAAVAGLVTVEADGATDAVIYAGLHSTTPHTIAFKYRNIFKAPLSIANLPNIATPTGDITVTTSAGFASANASITLLIDALKNTTRAT